MGLSVDFTHAIRGIPPSRVCTYCVLGLRLAGEIWTSREHVCSRLAQKDQRHPAPDTAVCFGERGCFS